MKCSIAALWMALAVVVAGCSSADGQRAEELASTAQAATVYPYNGSRVVCVNPPDWTSQEIDEIHDAIDMWNVFLTWPSNPTWNTGSQQTIVNNAFSYCDGGSCWGTYCAGNTGIMLQVMPVGDGYGGSTGPNGGSFYQGNPVGTSAKVWLNTGLMHSGAIGSYPPAPPPNYGKYFKHVLAHELGHMLNVNSGHVDPDAALMNAYTSPSVLLEIPTCPTGDDWDEILPLIFPNTGVTRALYAGATCRRDRREDTAPMVDGPQGTGPLTASAYFTTAEQSAMSSARALWSQAAATRSNSARSAVFSLLNSARVYSQTGFKTGVYLYNDPSRTWFSVNFAAMNNCTGTYTIPSTGATASYQDQCTYVIAHAYGHVVYLQHLENFYAGAGFAPVGIMGWNNVCDDYFVCPSGASLPSVGAIKLWPNDVSAFNSTWN